MIRPPPIPPRCRKDFPFLTRSRRMAVAGTRPLRGDQSGTEYASSCLCRHCGHPSSEPHIAHHGAAPPPEPRAGRRRLAGRDSATRARSIAPDSLVARARRTVARTAPQAGTGSIFTPWSTPGPGRPGILGRSSGHGCRGDVSRPIGEPAEQRGAAYSLPRGKGTASSGVKRAAVRKTGVRVGPVFEKQPNDLGMSALCGEVEGSAER